MLTPIKRKRLALAQRETYEAEVGAVGFIEELDAKKKTGTLRTLDKEAVTFVFDDPFFSDLKEALGVPKLYARLTGVGVFDVNDRLGSITEIEQFESLPHYPLVTAIDALAELPPGWLEGSGLPPNADDLNWLSNEMVMAFPESLEYPIAAPTEDGNVILEWIRPHSRVELEINFGERQLELYATNTKTGDFVEETFSKEDWETAWTHIKKLLLT